MLFRKFAAAAGTGVVLGALAFTATAFASDPGASPCGSAAGQFTAGVAQAMGSGFGQLVASLAPINTLNQDSLFNCSPQP